MKTIAGQDARTLTWAHPHPFQSQYELRAGDDLLATLRWRSAFGSLADAEAADGHWTFKRVGFLKPSISVRIAGADEDLAAFRVHWDGAGELVLGDGRRYEWRPANFWHTQWAWTDAAGAPLLHFRPAHLVRQADVEVSPAALAVPDLSLLSLLGWYLMVLRADEAAASVAVMPAVV